MTLLEAIDAAIRDSLGSPYTLGPGLERAREIIVAHQSTCEDSSDEIAKGFDGCCWIGVDLDGTLAYYDGWRGSTHIGDPIPLMVSRIKRWTAGSRRVKIVTARVHPNNPEADASREAITEWCINTFGFALEVTYGKDNLMVELWDDRAVQVVRNTGERVDGRDNDTAADGKSAPEAMRLERISPEAAKDGDYVFARLIDTRSLVSCRWSENGFYSQDIGMHCDEENGTQYFRSVPEIPK